ncbi:MAG: CBS domain-containing protein [Aldersonia sp.]|nr:CBS domain-containing protein [Aldersonia sp.]
MTATTSGNQDRTQRRFAVAEVMSRRPLLLRAAMRLEPAVELLVDNGYSGAPVIDRTGTLIGMLHALDVALMHLLPPDRDVPLEVGHRQILVGDVCRAPIRIAPYSTMRMAADMMRDHGTDRLVVVDNADHVMGVVTGHDLLRTVSRRGNLLSEIIDGHIAALGLTDVHADADYSGVVLLTGTVDSVERRDELVRAISAVDGVTEIDELLAVRR